MDRRTFFKRAGAGAGALIAAPQLELYNALFPQEEEKPKIKVEYEAGYIYYGDQQVMAVSNVTFDFRCEAIDVTTPEDYPIAHYIPGKRSATFSGEGLALQGNSFVDYLDYDQDLHICLNFSDTTIEADGYISNIGINAAQEEEPIWFFDFELIGDAIINDADTQEG